MEYGRMLRGERWLVTGATGMVGTILCRAAVAAGVEVVRLSRSGRAGSIACDLMDYAGMRCRLEAASPDRILHLAAMSKPALAQRDPALAHQVNVQATAMISAWCASRNRRLVFTSTDQVFSGVAGPHAEDDSAHPSTVYGRTKLDAEGYVLEAAGLVLRLGWVLNDNPSPRLDFIETALNRLRQGETVFAVEDEQRTPLRGQLLSDGVLGLLACDHRGTVHLAGKTHSTPYDLLRQRAAQEALDTRRVLPVSRRSVAPQGRPGDVRLDTALLAALLIREPSVAFA